jgi:hypothetical protein
MPSILAGCLSTHILVIAYHHPTTTTLFFILSLLLAVAYMGCCGSVAKCTNGCIIGCSDTIGLIPEDRSTAYERFRLIFIVAAAVVIYVLYLHSDKKTPPTASPPFASGL